MKEGQNVFRILTEPEVMFENFKMGICYHECGFEGSPKYLARVLDRADNKIKLYKIPFTIFQTIASFEKDEELQFKGFPMPYDVKVNAIGAGSKEVKYTVLPSMKPSPIDSATLDFLKKQKSVKEVINLFQEKNIEKHKTDGTWQKEQDRLEKLKEELKNPPEYNEEEDKGYQYPENEGDEPAF